MSLTLRAVYNAVIGGWGGFLAWLILDVGLRTQFTSPYADALLNGSIVGLGIGALVMSLDGILARRLAVFGRGLLIGTVAGVVGGMLGLVAGELLYQTLTQSDVWRVAGWTLFGLGIGLAGGWLSGSSRRALQGALGGACGGLLGSIAFLALRSSLGATMTGRATGFVLLGMAIGFGIGLFEVLLKTAWLKVVSSGPQEGREYSLTKPVTGIGRDDRMDVGLYNDRSVEPRHAEVRQEQGAFVLHALDPSAPVAVNNQPVTRHVLANSDRIGIGRFSLVFRDRKS